jgi:hypothetical protein
MATIDWTYDSTTHPVGGTPTPHDVCGLRTVQSQLINLVTGTAGADTFNVFDLKAGTVVLASWVTIVELPNEACDVILGTTGVDANGLMEAQELYTSRTAGASYPGFGTLLGHSVGGVDEPGTTVLIDATTANVGGALTSGKLRFTLVCAGGQGAGQ